MLRSFEVRAPQAPPTLGQQTDRQVRQYPDSAGLPADGKNLGEHFDILQSRLRLNAGALDWRQGPAGGSGGASGAVVHEEPNGDRDGTNQVYTTSHAFVPQALQFYVNGLRQRLGDTNDFTIFESQGVGSGYDSLHIVWAPLESDQLVVDYTQA